MSELAPHLAHWAALLGPLAPPFQSVVAVQAQRLALALGAVRVPAEAAAGEPDGFAGIGRLGPYERLLASEWLIAEELPEEFLRRAVMREHAFMQLARKETRAGLTCVVLLDSGPDQVGAPRIAQMAALVALSRRAAALGEELRWGVVQDPQTKIYPLPDAHNVAALLAARATRDPSADDLRAWAWLTDKAPLPDELWLVGGDALMRATAGMKARRLHIAEPLVPKVRGEAAYLVATVTNGSETTVVELPRAAVRVEAELLREPFATPPVLATRRARVSAQRELCLPADAPLHFSASGRRLIVEDRVAGAAGRTWVARRVPERCGEALANRDRSITQELTGARDRVVAVGWSRQRPLVVRVEGEHLEVGTAKLGFLQRTAPRNQLELQALRKVQPVVPLFCRDEAFVFAIDGYLFHSRRLGSKATELIGQPIGEVRGVRIRAERAAWLERGHVSGDSRIHISNGYEYSATTLDEVVGASDDVMLGGVAALNAAAATSFLGWRWPTATWGDAERALNTFNVLFPSRSPTPFEIQLHDGEPLALMARHEGLITRVGVVTLAPGGCDLQLVEQLDALTLPTDGSRVLQVAVSGSEATVAWLTENGELACWNWNRGDFLMRCAVSVVASDQEPT